MASIAHLLKQFSHFFGGNMLGLLLGLLTFPILTRLLTHEEYGVLALINATIAIAVALAKGGLSEGIIRFYHDYATDPARLRVFTATVYTRAAIVTTIVVTLYVVMIPSVERALELDSVFAPAFLVMAAYVALRPLNVAVLNYLRATGRTLFFNGTELAIRAIGVVLSLGLLILFAHDLTGYFLGIVFAEAVGTIILFRWLLTTHTFAPRQTSGELVWKLARFGVPLLLAEISYLMLQSADRYILVALHGEAVLGEYSVGYNIPSYINQLVMFPLSYAVVPLYTQLYTNEGRAKTERFLSRVLRYYIAGVLLLCAAYAAVARDAIIFLASESYASTADFSPIILAGLVFLGLNYILNAGLYLTKRTVHMLAIMLLAAGLNLVLNLALIPSWGPTGAAVATLVSCIASTVFTAILSLRYLRLHFDVGSFLYYALWSVALFIALMQITLAPSWLQLLAKLATGGLIVGLAAVLKEAELRTYIVNTWSRIRHRVT